MKTSQLSTGGGSALGGKKLILSAALIVLASISGYMTEEAYAGSMNFAASANGGVASSKWWENEYPELDWAQGSGPVPVVNDENSDTHNDVYHPGQYGGVEVIVEATVEFSKTIAKIDRIEFKDVYGDYDQNVFYPVPTVHGTFFIQYSDGTWVNIGSGTPDGNGYIVKYGPWYNVKAVKDKVATFIGGLYDCGGIIKIYEIKAFGPAPCDISGYVKHGDGTIINGATVTVRDSTNNPIAETHTTNNEPYAILDLFPGDYTVTASCVENYPFSPISLTLDADRNDIDLYTYKINGYVKHGDGTAIEGVTVNIKKDGTTVDTATTNASGFYEKRVGAGTYTIQPANVTP